MTKLQYRWQYCWWLIRYAYHYLVIACTICCYVLMVWSYHIASAVENLAGRIKSRLLVRLRRYV